MGVHVEVVRIDEGQRYDAHLGEPLQPAGDLDVIADHLLPADNSYDQDPYEYTTRSHSDGVMHVDLPAEWLDVRSEGLTAYGSTVQAMSASDDFPALRRVTVRRTAHVAAGVVVVPTAAEFRGMRNDVTVATSFAGLASTLS